MQDRKDLTWDNRIEPQEGVLDIPYPAVLQYRSASDIVSAFEVKWGERPAAVALPVTTSDGLLFRPGSGALAVNSEALPHTDVEAEVGLQYSRFAGPSENFRSIASSVREFAQQGCAIYLTLDLTVSFHNIPALTLTDIVGDRSSPICINKPQSQKLVGKLLLDAVREARAALEGTGQQLAGVALDIVNLWPMSTRGNNIELTCFCTSCQEWFQAGDLLGRLRTFPGPLNLALRDAGHGIDNMTDIGHYLPERELIGLSKLRGYTEAFDEDVTPAMLLTHATDLRSYMALRHQMTVTAIKAVFDAAFSDDPAVNSESPKRVLMCQGALYGWTAGIQLDRLNAGQECFDELWTDPTDPVVNVLKFPFRAYMATTARYQADTFFDLAAKGASPTARATTGIGLHSESEIRKLLEYYMHQALGAQLEPSAVGSLPPVEDSFRTGIVAQALQKDDLRRFVLEIDIPPGVQVQTRPTRRQQARQRRQQRHDERQDDQE